MFSHSVDVSHPLNYQKHEKFDCLDLKWLKINKNFDQDQTYLSMTQHDWQGSQQSQISRQQGN